MVANEMPAQALSAKTPSELPPELLRFWQTFADAQIRRGRRDIGAMVQAALEYLFEKGLTRLAPLVAAREEFEAFRATLLAELTRMQEAIDGADGAQLALPYTGKMYRIHRRTELGQPPEAAVSVAPIERAFVLVSEVESHRAALQRQIVATESALRDNNERMLQARNALRNQLMPYSPIFYDIATRLLAEADARLHATVTTKDNAFVTAPKAALTHDMPGPWHKRLLLTASERVEVTLREMATKLMEQPPPQTTEFETWLTTLNAGQTPPPPSPPVAKGLAQLVLAVLTLWQLARAHLLRMLRPAK